MKLFLLLFKMIEHSVDLVNKSSDILYYVHLILNKLDYNVSFKMVLSILLVVITIVIIVAKCDICILFVFTNNKGYLKEKKVEMLEAGLINIF